MGWIKNLANAASSAVKPQEIKDLQDKAGTANLVATAATVFFAAVAAISLVGAVLGGAVISGAVLFTATALLAIISYDVSVISGKINNGNWKDRVSLADAETQMDFIESVATSAASKGTIILTPERVQWLFDRLT